MPFQNSMWIKYGLQGSAMLLSVQRLVVPCFSIFTDVGIGGKMNLISANTTFGIVWDDEVIMNLGFCTRMTMIIIKLPGTWSSSGVLFDLSGIEFQRTRPMRAHKFWIQYASSDFAGPSLVWWDCVVKLFANRCSLKQIVDILCDWSKLLVSDGHWQMLVLTVMLLRIVILNRRIDAPCRHYERSASCIESDSKLELVRSTESWSNGGDIET